MRLCAFICALPAASALLAQQPSTHTTLALQQFDYVVSTSGQGPGPMMVTMFGGESQEGGTVTGKPFSAKEERHSLQVLGDGTRIERTETSMYYRDDQGRTRIEHLSPGISGITITDPVAGYAMFLDPATKTARKFPFASGGMMRTGAAGVAVKGEFGMMVHKEVREAEARLSVMGVPAPPETITAAKMTASKATAMPQPATEKLGTDFLNGVSADGTRTTVTIPAGQIGNDREIRVVNERWYSSDLQVLVKSTNSDPRFGDNTYQLTNIVRAAPDPALFQVPGDYTVQDLKRK